MKPTPPLDLARLKVLPLEQRRSLTRVEDILVPPDQPPVALSPALTARLQDCWSAAT